MKKSNKKEAPIAPPFNACHPFMYIRISSGFDLGAFDLNGKSDPYVKVFYKDAFIGVTPVCKSTLSPYWTDGNVFRVNIPKAELTDSKKIIHLEVWDRDALKKDDFMGECWIDGTDVINEVTDNRQCKLLPRSEKNKNEGKGSLVCEYFHSEPKLSEDYLAALAEGTGLGPKEIESIYETVQQVTGNRNEIRTVEELRRVLESSHKLEGLVAQLHVSGHSKVYDNLTVAFVQFQNAKKAMCETLAPLLFPAIDTDNSGKIDVKELVLALHCLSPTAGEEQKARFHFRFMDKDKNGTLDRAEIIEMNKFEWKMMRACAEAQFRALQPELLRQLKIADTYTTQQKITEMIKTIYDDIFGNPNLPIQGVDLLYKYMDKNNDGTINEEEYVQWRLDADAVQKFQTEIHEVMQQSVKKYFNQEELLQRLMPKIMTLARKF